MTLHQVDAFTDRPFAGNPAAVCLPAAPRAAHWMQQVAREMNLSETAFLTEQADGFALRWFTPTAEVDLCGHATLAAAHVLWETRCLATDAPARFDTKSGRLTAQRAGAWIEMDFPAEPVAPAEGPSDLADLLGATPQYVGRNRMDYLVALEAAATVRALQPDLRGLATLGARGLIVTAPADEPGYDFVSRFFAPGVGVPEDPVTGSAHCALGPYWQKRLGKEELTGYQASARGGTVRVQPCGDRVLLAGQAVTVLKAELLVEG